jgi:hypothetical protein
MHGHLKQNGSNTGKKRGFSVITGKTTYSELDIVDENQYKKLTDLDRKKFSAIN